MDEACPDRAGDRSRAADPSQKTGQKIDQLKVPELPHHCRGGIATTEQEQRNGDKDAGFDTKILRKVIRIRAQDKAARAEEQALIDSYLAATGDLFE